MLGSYTIKLSLGFCSSKVDPSHHMTGHKEIGKLELSSKVSQVERQG